jgi:hypothetical protein
VVRRTWITKCKDSLRRVSCVAALGMTYLWLRLLHLKKEWRDREKPRSRPSMANRVAVDDLRSRDVSMVCCKYYVDGLVSSIFTVCRLNRVSAVFEGSGRPNTFILAVAGERSASILPPWYVILARLNVL